MAIDLSELRDIDIADIGSWPQWLKTIAVFAVFCGIVYAGYHFIVREQVEDLTRLETEEKNLRNVFLDRKAKAINLPVYREQMVEMEEMFGIMVDQLPDETEVPQLLDDITQAGLARGLELSRFKPLREQLGDFYSTLPFDLQVGGSYHQFGQFISDLAGLPRIVTMGNITMVGSPDGTLKVNAVVKTYRYLDDDEAGAAGDDAPVRTVR
ncbi:MAG: type 4 fimbrial biogenesis protein PilO [marine bacterium B5-7]|nr:MAG: type 4 fimbrial biogenesis protein PilO [marine bacterium B5-7]